MRSTKPNYLVRYGVCVDETYHSTELDLGDVWIYSGPCPLNTTDALFTNAPVGSLYTQGSNLYIKQAYAQWKKRNWYKSVHTSGTTDCLSTRIYLVKETQGQTSCPWHTKDP